MSDDPVHTVLSFVEGQDAQRYFGGLEVWFTFEFCDGNQEVQGQFDSGGQNFR